MGMEKGRRDTYVDEGGERSEGGGGKALERVPMTHVLLGMV